MTFLAPEPYEPPHACSRPLMADISIGMRWQCDECMQVYRAEPLYAYGKNGRPHWVKQPSATTRREAIQHILMLEGTVAQQMYVGQHEVEEGDAEVRAALQALGVSGEEVDHAFDEPARPNQHEQ